MRIWLLILVVWLMAIAAANAQDVIIWTPTAGEYPLAAQPTSDNTEHVCFYTMDNAGAPAAELGCVATTPACLADLPNCRLELAVVFPLDGIDRVIRARSKRVVAGEDLWSNFSANMGVASSPPLRPIILPAP